VPLNVKNKLLKRQLKKAGIDLEEAQPSPQAFQKLLYLIEKSYEDEDDSRKTIDHSMDVLSHEMREIINELEEAHKETKFKESLMFQQAKFAQMGEMISMIAHQWRQPLNNISITASTMKIDILFDNKEKLLKHTKNILSYSQYLSDTINDFRNFFKKDKEMCEVYFEDLLENIFNIIGESLSTNQITVVKRFNYKEPIVSYENELKHVLINIIKNAEDALLESRVVNPYIKIETYRDGKYAVLEISDNAGGIDENNLKQIFNPYFSTKSNKNGTGLGLYMSKIIIEEHCYGKLEAYNGSEGSIFKIKLKP